MNKLSETSNPVIDSISTQTSERWKTCGL